MASYKSVTVNALNEAGDYEHSLLSAGNHTITNFTGGASEALSSSDARYIALGPIAVVAAKIVVTGLTTSSTGTFTFDIEVFSTAFTTTDFDSFIYADCKGSRSTLTGSVINTPPASGTITLAYTESAGTSTGTFYVTFIIPPPVV